MDQGLNSSPPHMADYPEDSDVEDICIKDSTGTTVAVLVQSKMRRLTAEKTRAAFASLAVLDAHDIHNDDVDEYIPILDSKGKITGMGYTRKNATPPRNSQEVSR